MPSTWLMRPALPREAFMLIVHLVLLAASKERMTGAKWHGTPPGARALAGVVTRAPVVELRGAEVVMAAEGGVGDGGQEVVAAKRWWRLGFGGSGG
jgi:hypothetical protein